MASDALIHRVEDVDSNPLEPKGFYCKQFRSREAFGGQFGQIALVRADSGAPPRIILAIRIEERARVRARVAYVAIIRDSVPTREF